MTEMIREVRFCPGPNNRGKEKETVVRQGDNGDFYIATVLKGEGIIGETVHYCVSGGPAASIPGLIPAINTVFQVLVKADSKFVKKSS